MPMFEIETYKVSTQLNRYPGETRPSRVIEMTGPVLYHGIQNRAIFAFNASFDGIWTAPVVGYLTDGGFAGLAIAGWFPLAEFPHYYDIVRSERPIHVFYSFRESGATSGYLSGLGLGTSTERIGEGPTDSTATLSSMLAAHLGPIHDHLLPMPTAADLPITSDR